MLWQRLVAAEGSAAEFSSFEKDIEPFDVISENSSPKGFLCSKNKFTPLPSADSRYPSDLRSQVAVRVRTDHQIFDRK